MDQATRATVVEKNEKIIAMVIERAKRDFPADIALIGLPGSYGSGDFHEKSDLDLIIINDTERGWGISGCFILGDVGYDIYCTPWSPRIEAQSNLESPWISCLVDLRILYCAKPEYLDKFNAYRQRALERLAKPIGPDCIGRAGRYLDEAKKEYANALLADGLGKARYAAARMSLALINALMSLNNAYFTRGFKRYSEQIAALAHKPQDFMELYAALIDARSVDEIRRQAGIFLRRMAEFSCEMELRFVVLPKPIRENMVGSYEELWCNYRNKLIKAVTEGDKRTAYLVGSGAQEYFDDMRRDRGTKPYDLMKEFDPEDIGAFLTAFLRMMEEYLEECRQVGLGVVEYSCFEELYADYMGTKE
jgi:hypothetical protein